MGSDDPDEMSLSEYQSMKKQNNPPPTWSIHHPDHPNYVDPNPYTNPSPFDILNDWQDLLLKGIVNPEGFQGISGGGVD